MEYMTVGLSEIPRMHLRWVRIAAGTPNMQLQIRTYDNSVWSDWRYVGISKPVEPNGHWRKVEEG